MGDKKETLFKAIEKVPQGNAEKEMKQTVKLKKAEIYLRTFCIMI